MRAHVLVEGESVCVSKGPVLAAVLVEINLKG